MFGRVRRPQSEPSDLSGRPARGRHATGRGRPAEVRVARPRGPRAEAGTRGSGRRHGLASTGLTSAGLALAVSLVPGVAFATVGPAQAPSRSHTGYVTTGTGGWLNDAPLQRTATTDQYAQATVDGLTDAGQLAGFLLRYADRGSRVRVSVSGTGWRIEPSGQAPSTGLFAHGPSGVLRVEAQGRTVRIRWNGTLVASRSVPGTFPGRYVIATLRQGHAGVVLGSLRAGTPAPATTPAKPGTPGGTGTAHPVLGDIAGGSWLSGAASEEAAAGTYGAWRGSAVRIGGTWDDTWDGQVNQWTICGDGAWAHWDAPLDLAFGGIYHSRKETWAAAARGAYDARWSAALTTIRSCWGTRDPGLLYLRFAHEMNLPNDWSVHAGEEAAFRAAITRFSDLRYRILPRAKVVLCPNDGTNGGLGGLDVRNLWPGLDAQGRRVADVYAVDSYNAWPHVTTAAAFADKINDAYPDGAPLGIERHRQFAQRMGVPFAIGEWSNNGDRTSTGGGGESPVYVQQFYAWAKAHSGDVAHPVPGQLLYEVHFNLWREYSFWPATIQPRTAAAYRALPWGR